MLWIANLGVAAVTVAVLAVALSFYRDRMTAISSSASPFLTAELRLLQELKAQTDQQLFDKDREIAQLYRLYTELVKNNAPSSELSNVTSELDRAKEERRAIASRAALPAADSSSAPGAPGQLLSSAEIDLTSLLQRQIEGLQAQLDRSRGLIEALNQERASLLASRQQDARQFDDAAKESEERLSELTAALKRQEGEVRAALAGLKELGREGGPVQPLSLQELRTQALVRALVGSPQIRATYPDLVADLDRFLQVYGRRERLAGQREAYASAESLIGQLSASTNPPPGGSGP